MNFITVLCRLLVCPRGVRHGIKNSLVIIFFIAIVGDSLIEPFWPEGTGIGQGFLR